MLTLCRKVGEKVVIGTPPHTVELEVVEVRGDKVRLGVTAHRDVPVRRGEVSAEEWAARWGRPPSGGATP